MSNNNLVSAKNISDVAFLEAFNDVSLSNLAVLEKLNTDWTAIGVKLRSERLRLHTTVDRTGGKAGTFNAKPADALAQEALIWLKDGTIQMPPNGGVYVSLADRAANPTTTTATTAAPSSASAPAAAAPSMASPAMASSTPAPEATSLQAAPAADAVSFQVNIYNVQYTFTGATNEEAQDKVLHKLRELDFSQANFSVSSSRTPISLSGLRNGGSYTVSKQLKAAANEFTCDVIAMLSQRPA